MQKNALSVTGVTGGKCMSETVRFSIEVDFVTDDTCAVDACTCVLVNTINDTIYDMFDVLGLPFIRVETNVLDNERDELVVKVEYNDITEES